MASTKVVVNLPHDDSYDVRIGPGLLDGLGEYARSVTSAGEALVVSDSHVAPLYLDRVKGSLHEARFRVVDITIPAGETSKTLNCAGEIWEAMAQSGFARDSVVVALGGGVIGDIAGFVAACYMRGTDIIQVPTTLLAMVDSSVGGKTGINLEAGKNLVGAFKQPIHVCASTDVLATLPEREWVCGCAEIAKSALIESDDFFFWLGGEAASLAQREEAVVTEAIARSVIFKANVVAVDTRESKGVRECLNYGHTFGHAIESVAGYGVFSHGAAVAEGMRFAARLSVDVLGASTDFVSAQDELLDSLGLYELDWSAQPEALLEAMMHDKKVRGGTLRFVLARDIGQWEVVEVGREKVLEHLNAWFTSKTSSQV